MPRTIDKKFSTLEEYEIDRLRESLHTKCFGKHLFFRKEVDSTNSWARVLAENGAEEGTVVLAQTQTAGRGRLGRKWISPKGGLWFSVILRPDLKAREAVKLVFAAGLAVADILQHEYKMKVETKWPNDVHVKGKKICGILCEMNTKDDCINYAILGIGLNANFSVDELFESLDSEATSLQDELETKISLETLLASLLEELERDCSAFMESGSSPLLNRWKHYASFLGQQVVIRERGVKGLALDVDVDGALLVKLEDGSTQKILVGDVSLLQ